jgi:ATP/maltotriose-dependent transcriptional regulator MalT
MELLEREAYLSEMSAALAEARRGMGRLTLVSGEAGIGKTSLIEDFAQQHRQKVTVLWGACDALFTPRPLGPLHDMALQIGRGLPELLADNESRTAVFSIVLDELKRRPAIMVFEDVHWADEATLDLLRFIGRRIQQTSSLLVITYRDDELGHQHPLRIVLGDLATSTTARRLALKPLSVEAVRELAGDRPLDVEALHRQTGGNPYYITEVLANPESGIPGTVRDSVLARVARLSLSGHAVLEAAAVIGQRVEPWLLAAVTGADAPAVDECIGVGVLLAQAGELAFRHELARETILAGISPARRRILHRLVLEALKSSPGGRSELARLAHHAQGSDDYAAVLEFAPVAARQAAGAGAHREASALYALLLRYADYLSPTDHAQHLLAYSRQRNLTDQPDEAISALRTALEVWRKLQDPIRQGELLAILTIMLRNNGSNSEAEQVSQAAISMLEALPPSRELAVAYRAQATLRLANSDHAEAIYWGEKAIALAEGFQDLFVLAMAHITVGAAWLFLDYERGRAYLEQRMKIAHEIGNAVHIVNLYAYFGSACGELYQFTDAERYLSEGIEYVADRGLDIFVRFMRAWLVLTWIQLGRWNAATEAFNQLLQSPQGSAIRRIPTLVALGRLRSRRGDPGVDDVLEEARQLAASTATLPHLGLVYAARAEAAWLAGDRQGVLKAAGAVYDLALSKRHPWLAGELAYWRWKAGEKVEIHDWMAKPFTLQIAGDWQAAAGEWERLGCPYEQARALADGDLQAQLAALNIFEQLGARPSADLLREKLRVTGAPGIPRRPRSSTRDNPFGITNRQLEILALLIAGLSNAEIAARMHISLKTVDHHVSAVLSKLGVHSRQQAATLAQNHPYFQKK